MNSPATPEAPQRLFLALWPDSATRAALAAAARDLLDGVRARPVPAENLHLTLAFLGPTAAARRLCAEAAAARLRLPGFRLVLDEAGFFARAGVVWLGCRQAPAPLLELVQGLRTGLADCGFAPDTRPYRAHVTVGRKLRGRPRLAPPPPLAWEVRDFVLVRSRTRPDGAAYEVLTRWPLLPPEG